MIKLLLVDDEQIIREGIQKMLPTEEMNIRLIGVCANAFEALDCIADDMPDILLTDVKMPQMDGLALIERALKMNPRLESIILSGHDDFAYAQKAISLGVREYLLKPCTKQEITDCLTRICGQIRRQRQLCSMQLDEHMEIIRAITDELIALTEKGTSGKVTSSKVKSVIQSHDGELLAREAYFYMVIHYEASSDRGFAILKEAYAEEEDYYALIANWISDYQNHILDKKRLFVKKMCAYIQEHYQEESLSLQFLADQVVHMRADYIGREFAKDTGMKLSAYLLKYRMEKAKLYLDEGVDDLYIYEVAEKVGLGHNPQYFSQLFRRYTGMTPKEYADKKP